MRTQTTAVQRSWWAQVDTLFLGVLALSLLVHFAGAGYVASQPLPLESEGKLEDLPVDRFVRQEFTLHVPAPKKVAAVAPGSRPAARPQAEAPAGSPAPSKAALDGKVQRAGLLGVIGSGVAGEHGFADLFSGASSDVAAALDGAARRLGANDVADLGPARKGDAVGRQVAGVELATAGVRSVNLAERAPAVVARVVEADVEVAGPEVDASALAGWLARHKGGLTGCYERELKVSPSLAGKLVLRFEVTPRGRVTALDFGEDSTLLSASLRQCVASVARGWVLPFTPEEETAVSFPFVFAPAGG